MDHPPPPSRDAIRARFPALAGPTVFLDNAGGSQVPVEVADRMRAYLLGSYVQLGADYRLSREAVATVDAARRLLATLFGATADHAVVVGPSTSQLCAMLADAYAASAARGRDEVVVCEAGHEANIGPWTRLAERGFVVRHWRPRPGDDARCELSDLDALLSERTRVVAVHHVSNLLGRIEDVAAIAARAHAVGARVVVDGVAGAPHRVIDMHELGADYYVFSTYKTFGPHLAALCGRLAAFAELARGPNHYFTQSAGAPYAFELGGVCHEGCAALLGVGDLLAFVAGDPAAPVSRDTVRRAYRRFHELEDELTAPLLRFLRERDDVRIVGPAEPGPSRVPTVSFVHRTRSSRSIAERLNAQGLAIRYGHFYAHRLATALGLAPEDGVVRASLLHYNTPEEVGRLCEALADAFDAG
ncbi:MAG: aminotransferase class V-fold PLP-dependent enzyme [Planctomycetes bacterium]|nr:aminotransferase class V-fold PLP-dependent enzyme [Planctomycetota bacterium]